MNDYDVRSKLISLQQTNPTLKAEHDRRIREMMEVELKPGHRRGWLVSGIISFLATAQWAFVAITTWPQVQWPAHTAFVALAVGCMMWAILAMSIVRAGKIVRAVHLPWGIGIITLLAYVLFIMSFAQAPYTRNLSASIMILFGGLSALVSAGVVIVLYRMDQTKFTLQEELLRMQLQIADLGERK